MSHISTMYQAVEFMEENLREPVTVADIAGAVSYSLYHFCRVFNQVVQHSPYDYLMRRRLTESARELLETDQRITDIAFTYQFNSLETYSRAFKRMFGQQPSQWKKQGQLDPRFLMSPLSLAHLQHLNRGDYLKPVFAEKDAFHVAGLMTLVGDDAPAVISTLWEMLRQELNRAIPCVETGAYYGVVYYPQNWPDCGFFYLAGLEIEAPNITDAALVVKTIPALKYARFIHQGPARNRKLTWDYIYQTWLPRSGRCLVGNLEIEYYGPESPEFDQAEFERKIYIPVR